MLSLRQLSLPLIDTVSNRHSDEGRISRRSRSASADVSWMRCQAPTSSEALRAGTFRCRSRWRRDVRHL